MTKPIDEKRPTPERIAQLRALPTLTQAEAAELAGRDPRTIRLWQRKRGCPGPGNDGRIPTARFLAWLEKPRRRKAKA